MSRVLRSVAMLVATAAFAATAQAQYSQTLGEFNGPTHNIGDPFPFTFTVGTFTGIPGGTIASATIHGTFGNSVNPSTAAARVYLGSTLVATCVYQTPCWGPTFTTTPWAFAFNITNFSELAGPTATLTVWQDSEFNIRLGETTLDIVYSTVPEPASLALLATGLVGLVPLMRRKLKA